MTTVAVAGTMPAKVMKMRSEAATEEIRLSLLITYSTTPFPDQQYGYVRIIWPI